MSERDKVIKKDDDKADVEAHKKLAQANEEKGSEDEPETPDVEAHKKLTQ